MPRPQGPIGRERSQSSPSPSYALTPTRRRSSLGIETGWSVMTRYKPAAHYSWFGIAAVALGGVSGWLGWNWQAPLCYVAGGLFVLTAAALLAMAVRPPIEVSEGHLAIGRRIVPWMDIRRLDRTGWMSPLIARITLFDDSRVDAPVSRRPGFLQWPAAPVAATLARRADRWRALPAVLGRGSPAGRTEAGASAALPHFAPGGRSRGGTPVPAPQDRRQPRSEEFADEK